MAERPRRKKPVNAPDRILPAKVAAHGPCSPGEQGAGDEGFHTVSEPPRVSVVLPVWNEAALIQRVLGAVLTQDYPPERLEVLVVDGGSTDGTRELVAALAQGDPRLRLLENPARRQAHALNLALEAAQGEVIVRVDGHTLIAPDYVRTCVATLQRTGADAVGGTLRAVGSTPLARAIATAYTSPFGVPSRYRFSRRAGYAEHIYMGAWPRATFERFGRFNPTLTVNEDYELSYRIRKGGGRVYLNPALRSAYYGRETLADLARQYARYGADKVRMLRQHPASLRPRQVVAPLFVLAVIAGGLLAPFSARMGRVWRAVLLSYALANALVALREVRPQGWAVAWRLPAAFAVLHLSWGLGFWAEIARQLAHSLRRPR